MAQITKYFDSFKDFVKFYALPTGPNLILQIGSYLCLFFFLSSLRNIAQQMSAYNNCSMDQNFYDHVSIWFSFIIAGLALLGWFTTNFQIFKLFKNRDQ